MANIAMLCDRIETDELGIRLTAEEMEIDLEYFPFHKVSVAFDTDGFSYRSLGKDYTAKLSDIRVVLNRTQSKSRRLYATDIFEAIGAQVLNPMTVEQACQSKVRTLLAFATNGIRVPRTIYLSANVKERTVLGDVQDNCENISALISQDLGSEKVVVKPDAGTHGLGVTLAEGPDELLRILKNVSPTITNPSGVVAQELIPKWFYDLRIVVRKEKGKAPHCHETALARGGFKEFRTNTFLGNMVFRAHLPTVVRRQAEASALALGGNEASWMIALDAMPRIGDDLTEGEEVLRQSFDDLEEPFRKVTMVKQMPNKKRNFRTYNREITRAYNEYMASEPYAYIKSVVDETLEKCRDSIYFHEGNACPEFWEQTRIVGGVDIAQDLLTCAIGLVDS